MLLNAHSYYSLHYGTLSPTALVEKAAAAGHRVLALTDINNTSGHLEFVRACQEHSITPITGIEFHNGDECCYIGLPRNQEGVRELNEYLSEHELSPTPFPKIPPLFEHSELMVPFWPGTEAQYPPPNAWIGVRPEGLRWHAQARIGSLKERCVALHPLSFALAWPPIS